MSRYTRRVILLVCALCVVLSGMSFAVDGVVNASALHVRTETSTEADSIGRVYAGETVDVAGRVGDWYIVNYNGQAAYVFAEYVDMGDVQVQSSMGSIIGSTVNVRSAPGTDNEIVGRLMDGTMVNILAIENGWYKIKFVDLVGYVHPDYISVDGLVFTYMTVQDDGTTTVSYTNDDMLAATTIGAQVVECAYKYLGYSYVYGGESPEEGFDCSGLVQYVYSQLGYSLMRTATDQYVNNGTDVPYDQLQLGDLVFFSRGSSAIGHVGIYVGDGYFIHATSPGDVVRVTALSTDYYTSRYVGAKRIA